MVNIIYRHYKEGDDDQLAEVFNLAFQMGGFGFLRTPKNWNWRYFQSPNFEPEMIQIAEDLDIHKIVGAICVNPIEKIMINDIEYLNADINDVSCHPEYTKRGIAKKLMEMAVDYMKKKKCDISMLTASNNGFPKKKIYKKFGYKDIDKVSLFINFPNLFRLMKDLPICLLLFPILFMVSYIPRFFNRFLLKSMTYFKDFSYEIVFNKKHFEYMEVVKDILKKNYTGSPIFSKKKWFWARIKVSSKRHKPTYIIIKKNKKIIGGASLTHVNAYSSKYGIKIRIGIIHEIFLNRDQFNNKRDLYYGHIYLIDKIMKAATQRFIGLLFINVSSYDKYLRKGIRTMRFMNFGINSVMLKPLKENLKISKPTKPLFLPTYVSLGFP